MATLPSGIEWIFVILIIVVVFFGAKKLPELARSFGKATTEYEKARIESKKELQRLKDGTINNNNNNNKEIQKLEEIADTLGIDHANKTEDELRTAIESELERSKK